MVRRAKKLFDFTCELKKFNKSGGSDCRSFVEQLDNDLRLPAKVHLRYDLAGKDGGLLRIDILQGS